jgi:hypothetical protein
MDKFRNSKGKEPLFELFPHASADASVKRRRSIWILSSFHIIMTFLKRFMSVCFQIHSSTGASVNFEKITQDRLRVPNASAGPSVSFVVLWLNTLKSFSLELFQELQKQSWQRS